MFSVAEQIELASQFERSQLRLFEGVGHALHWEQPEAFVEELLKIVPGT